MSPASEPCSILLSTSPRPWNKHKISLVSRWFCTKSGSRFSHASIRIGLSVYTFALSGLHVRGLGDFVSDCYEHLELPLRKAIRPDRVREIGSCGRYDTAAVLRAAFAPTTIDATEPCKLTTLRFTCVSFVAVITRDALGWRGNISRLVTPDELLNRWRRDHIGHHTE